MGQSEPALARPLAITACGVLSSIGIGFEAFTAALQAGHSGQQSVADLFSEELPSAQACTIPDFKVSTFLGTKGTSFFDRSTALVVVACGLALQHSDLVITDQNRDRIGIAVGTSTGSIKSISDYSRESLVQDRPYLVNPVLFPNTVMNCAAGQAAIWYGLKGVNATVSGGQLSSLQALRYATMIVRQGYADVLLVGGVEEFSPHTAWGFHHAGVLKDTDTLVGEGCAVFAVEDAMAVQASGRTALAEILACEVGVHPEADADRSLSEELARCIRRALDRSGVTPDQVWAVSKNLTGHPVLDRVEEEGLQLGLGHQPVHQLSIKRAVGECYSAAGALQLAALLALYATTPGSGGRIALVTSVGHDGAVGCAVIKEGQT
jgi:3-oxoacyl-[acyl-carrier-protein] synthase II